VLTKKISLPQNARVVSVLSGGNVDLSKLKEWL
jgi:hypothetical protein